MGWVAGLAGTLISGYLGKKASDKATSAQQQSNQAAIDYQKYMFDKIQANGQPYMQAGQGSLSSLAAVNGGNYDAFKDSPDYKFALDQGLYSIDHSAAARGRMNSGGADMDRMTFASGLASQNLNNWRASQMGLAQLGQASAAGVGAAGMGSASNIGGYLQNQGNAAASGALTNANIYSQTLSGLAGIAGGAMKPATASSYAPSTGYTPSTGYASGGPGTFWGYS